MFTLATSQVHNSHLQLVATIWDSVNIKHFLGGLERNNHRLVSEVQENWAVYLPKSVPYWLKLLLVRLTTCYYWPVSVCYVTSAFYCWYQMQNFSRCLVSVEFLQRPTFWSVSLKGSNGLTEHDGGSILISMNM